MVDRRTRRRRCSRSAADRDDLPELALSLGSDVPFFLVGGTAYATGRGEVLTPLPPMTGDSAAARAPRGAGADEGRVRAHHALLIRPWASTPIATGFASFTNDFEEPVFAMLPRLRNVQAADCYDAGAAWASMTGSGSTIVGAFANAATRDAAAARFATSRERAGL